MTACCFFFPTELFTSTLFINKYSGLSTDDLNQIKIENLMRNHL